MHFFASPFHFVPEPVSWVVRDVSLDAGKWLWKNHMLSVKLMHRHLQRNQMPGILFSSRVKRCGRNRIPCQRKAFEQRCLWAQGIQLTFLKLKDFDRMHMLHAKAIPNLLQYFLLIPSEVFHLHVKHVLRILWLRNFVSDELRNEDG